MRVRPLLACAIALGVMPAVAAQPAAKSAKTEAETLAEHVRKVIRDNPKSVDIVTFGDPRLKPVTLVRGTSERPTARQDWPGNVPRFLTGKSVSVGTVIFAGRQDTAVRVVHGGSGLASVSSERRDVDPAGRPARANTNNVETVTFADLRSVTVLRGSVDATPAIELFNPATEADLDRVASAVDGAESSHGADLRMWRSELRGPQGPMQVSLAAALDVGGGDRFDMTENRVLGRAYLARLYQRYGNWLDAVAAYNWGPANMDAWINAGRPAENFPLEVERYRDRVLREVALSIDVGPLSR